MQPFDVMNIHTHNGIDAFAAENVSNSNNPPIYKQLLHSLHIWIGEPKTDFVFRLIVEQLLLQPTCFQLFWLEFKLSIKILIYM